MGELLGQRISRSEIVILEIAEKLFSAAEARQKFTEPGAGLRALQKFTEAYGSLVLCSLCLRNR